MKTQQKHKWTPTSAKKLLEKLSAMPDVVQLESSLEIFCDCGKQLSFPLDVCDSSVGSYGFDVKICPLCSPEKFT